MATHISVSGEESRRQYRFSCFLLDLDSGFLRRDGQEVPLRPKSFEVLTHLVLRHGKLVSRDDLVEAVWPNAAVTDNSLAQCLFEIRRALEDDRQTIVRTVARRGYVFDASVSVASNDGPPPLDKVPETASPSTSSSGIGGVAGVPPWTAPNDLADELHGARDNLPLRIDSRAPARVRRSLKALGLGIAALAGVGLVTAALSGLIGRVPPPETTVLELAAPDGQRFLGYPATLALSPDARQVVFSTVPAGTAVERMQRRGASGGSPLMIRALNLPTAQALKGTEGGTYPFWSPDGKRVGFLANAGADNGGVLRTVRLADGSVSAVADVALGRGAWSASGIVFTGSDGRLYQVSEDGGPPRPVTELDVSRGEYRHAWPTFLPDGRRFLYLALSIDERRVTSGLQPDSRSGVYLSSIDSPARTRLLDAVTSIEYAAGHLLYHRSGSLIAQRFDDGRAQLTGDAIPIVEAIAFSGFDGLMAASTSQSGLLVYQRGGHGLPQGTLTWFDRNGRKMNAITPPGDYRYATLSPRRQASRRGLQRRQPRVRRVADRSRAQRPDASHVQQRRRFPADRLVRRWPLRGIPVAARETTRLGLVSSTCRWRHGRRAAVRITRRKDADQLFPRR
jgi:DNA-binding winged helix-turn-helix (wHTH) protein